ncbi:MAG: hypothetical protein QOG55_885 [Acidobacteriaceae bacterium]|jgi:hypothetical protein|nr:hypothetical protein [Acidobacteriaceae bacterium]
MTQKNQIMLLGVLVLIMAVVWYINRTTSPTSPGNVLSVQNYQLLAVENPQLHRDKMEAAQKTEYHSMGRNPFSEVAAPKEQPQVNKAASRGPVGPPVLPPPPPPTLPGNMKFFGYGTIPNGTLRRAFLSDGEEVYIVGEGDTLLGRFRIVKINNANLEFEEIATGRRNTVTMQEEQSAPPA